MATLAEHDWWEAHKDIPNEQGVTMEDVLGPNSKAPSEITAEDIAGSRPLQRLFAPLCPCCGEKMEWSANHA